MGFSVSAAAAIIGVSILMIVEIFVGNTIPLYTDIQESYKDMKNRAIEELQTMMNIYDINTSANASNYDLNITLNNTGSTVINLAYLTLLINGSKTSFTSSSSYVFPENSVYINAYNLAVTGEKKIKIIAKNGISDYKTYYV